LDGMIGLLSFVLALLASPFKSKLQLHVCSIFDRKKNTTTVANGARFSAIIATWH
jgi:hypothetical protein